VGYIAPLILGCCALSLAQESMPKGDKSDARAATFQAKVDLVLVPVVVRDTHRRPIGNLTKDDFQLFDNGKPQTIASFSTVERTKGTRENDKDTTAAPMADSGQAGSVGGKDSRERYFVYLFDDVNIRFADMANVRAAALSHFQNNFAAGDHASIYSTSGKTSLEFTTDRERLEGTVSKLRWGQAAGSGGMQCPDVSYYIADLVVIKADSQALSGLIKYTLECAHVVNPGLAKQIALAAATRELIIGARNTQLALSTLRRAIRRLSGMPGQRVIVLASPGFFAQTPEAIKATAEVLELAAKYDVIINGLSVRGVILAEEEEDVTRRVLVSRRVPPGASSPEQVWIRDRRDSARADGDVMNDLAEGTGGVFFHDNNNLRVGFEQVATAPEFSYVLGFSPTELMADGTFHSLRVRLQNEKGASVEARRGYYAFKPDPKTSQSSTAELEDEIFSRDEKSDLPVVVQTGYSKPKDANVVKVLVTAKIDVTSLPHKDVGGRSLDSFDVATTIFDQEGGYVTGTAETVTFSSPATAPSREDPAVTLHWEFPEIKAGSYLVRLVIREPGSKALTTINRTLMVR
jgi:VWFA-related protein